MVSHHEQPASKWNGEKQHRELWPAYNANVAPSQASTEGLFQQTRLFSTVGPLTHNACMNRDVSWQRIMVAILIGCAVFAGGKLAYGFQVSNDDIIGIAISLAVVFGLAALILVFRDKVTLKPNMSAEERDAAITKSSKRLHRGWATALFIMALVALPVHAFGLKDEPFLFYSAGC
jgi:hypothetical protein